METKHFRTWWNENRETLTSFDRLPDEVTTVLKAVDEYFNQEAKGSANLGDIKVTSPHID